MINPKRLKKGDTVAIVSLSRGMLGEPMFLHKLHIAKQRLEEYGLRRYLPVHDDYGRASPYGGGVVGFVAQQPVW